MNGISAVARASHTLFSASLIFSLLMLAPASANWRDDLKSEKAQNNSRLSAIDAEANPIVPLLKGAEQQFDDAKSRMAAHNANVCTYDQGHPEQCDSWVAEGQQIENEETNAQQSLQSYVSRLQSLKDESDQLIARNQQIDRLLSRVQLPHECSSGGDCEVSGSCGSFDGNTGKGICQP